MRRGQAHMLFLGLLLASLGILLLLHTHGRLHLGRLLVDYWPVLVICTGVYVLLRALVPAEAEPCDEEGPLPAAGDTMVHQGVWGDIRLSSESDAFRGGSVRTVFGDISIDLTRATVAQGEHKLEVACTFGEVEIHTRIGMPVAVRVSTVLGDVKVFGEKRSGLGAGITYQSPGYAQAEGRLSISVSQVVGEVTVR
jgi:predicted membrane protein